MKNKKAKLSQAFQRWLVILVAIAFLATTLFLWIIQTRLSENNAISLLSRMKNTEEWHEADSALMADRLKVMCCLIDTLAHGAEYQQILDATRPEESAELKTVWPITGDDRYYRLNELARAEIDNTYQLAALLRGRTEQFFVVTEPEIGRAHV